MKTTTALLRMFGLVFLMTTLVVPMGGCLGNDCQDITTTTPRDGTGTVTYVPGDGLTTYVTKEVSVQNATPSSLLLGAGLLPSPRGNNSDSRTLSLSLTGLEPGKTHTYSVNDGPDVVKVCVALPNQPTTFEISRDGTCLPFEGTADVKQLNVDCHEDQPGEAGCADTIDITVIGKATMGTTTLDVNLTITSAEHWSTARCPEADGFF